MDLFSNSDISKSRNALYITSTIGIFLSLVEVKKWVFLGFELKEGSEIVIVWIILFVIAFQLVSYFLHFRGNSASSALETLAERLKTITENPEKEINKMISNYHKEQRDLKESMSKSSTDVNTKKKQERRLQIITDNIADLESVRSDLYNKPLFTKRLQWANKKMEVLNILPFIYGFIAFILSLWHLVRIY